METTTTDVNTNQGVVDESSSSNSPADTSLTDNFWEEGEQSEVEEQEAETTEQTDEETTQSHETEEKSEFPKAEERKAQLNEEIRQMSARVGQLKSEISQYEGIKSMQSEINDARVTPEQLEELGLDPQDAALQAILHNQQVDQQQSELREIEANIADLQYNLAIDRAELLKDYPVFDQKSSEYDEKFTQWATEKFARDANLRTNEEGQPISASQKLYDYMSDLAEMRTHLVDTGSKRAAKSAARQSANVMNVGGTAMGSSDADDEKQFVNNFFK